MLGREDLVNESHSLFQRAERLIWTMRKMAENGITEQLKQLRPERASREEIEYVHATPYVQQVEAVCKRGGGMLDLDTPVCRDTCETALLAAGGLIKAVDDVMHASDSLKHVFALIRPPGHHATSMRGMGFCIYNNIAIAAEHLKRRYGLHRILIVDWDVHHGNGTQQVFFEDPSVLYFSTHQHPHYPGTGWIDEVGRREGQGFTVNVPLPAGTGDAGYLYALNTILVPIAREFKPEFVLVSAGFDAHAADPLASMNVTSQGFGLFTDLIVELARKSSQGRVVMALEGGYNLEALAESIISVFKALLANGEGKLETGGEPTSAIERVRKRVEEITVVQREYWGL
ncbi:MAG: histone deacetylase [Methanophagales archaeon ANME-1-THS]|nr:MAG: histone deacetylase [Methanophagales archaeon ANME-1-THS]